MTAGTLIAVALISFHPSDVKRPPPAFFPIRAKRERVVVWGPRVRMLPWVKVNFHPRPDPYRAAS